MTDVSGLYSRNPHRRTYKNLSDSLLKALIIWLYNPCIRDGGSASLIKTCRTCIFKTVACSPIIYFTFYAIFIKILYQISASINLINVVLLCGFLLYPSSMLIYFIFLLCYSDLSDSTLGTSIFAQFLLLRENASNKQWRKQCIICILGNDRCYVIMGITNGLLNSWKQISTQLVSKER